MDNIMINWVNLYTSSGLVSLCLRWEASQDVCMISILSYLFEVQV